jgi:DNA-binding NarL/FixJ family response regulator
MSAAVNLLQRHRQANQPPTSMRILIVDDSELVRRGIRELFPPEGPWEICGEAANSAEALSQAQTLEPEVILLDISMPGTDGLETARLLREQNPETKILIMSQHDVSLLSEAAIEAGANGCVDKSRLSVDVLTGILSRLRP